MPGRPGSWGRSRPDVLLPLQVRAPEHPADDRRGSQALRHARGLRHEPGWRRAPDRDDGVHEQGLWTSSRRSPATSGFADAYVRRRSTSRSSSTARSGRSRRSTTPIRACPAASAVGERRSRASTRSRRRRTSRSSCRRARSRSTSRRSTAPTSRRRSERTRSTRRGARRSPVSARRDLPPRLLPLPRRGGGHRARHLRGLPVRDHPPLQRDADVAGIRRPRPDVRGRGRRERRDLRTHQGRSARRALRARCDRAGIPEGLRTRSSTRTS